MKVLVIGGAGYVGSTLVQILLSQGHKVRVVDNLMYGGRALLPVWANPDFEFNKADLRDRQAMDQALKGVEAVVLLAAIVGDPACARQPELARSVNLEASLQLLGLCKEHRIARLVFASTCSNYGKMKESDQYVDETSELRPVSLYAETKVAVERALLDPLQTGGVCATALRFATVFGVSPRMRFDLTVNEFTMELLTKGKLKVFGEQFWRPYIHVRDMASAITLVLESPRDKLENQVFNVGATEQNHTKRQLVEMIQPYAPEAIVEYVQKQEDPRDYRVSFERIQRLLAFRCHRSVEQGIQEVARLVSSGALSDFESPEYRNS
jgi:nucleoside-diphosphate-sugar epimerase